MPPCPPCAPAPDNTPDTTPDDGAPDRRALVERLLTTQLELSEQLFARRLEPLLRTPTRLTVQQLRALAFLQIDGEASAHRLAEELGVSAATVSGIVDRLEAAGMATRRPDPQDGRVRLVAPTERGTEAIRGVVADDPSLGAAMLDGLTTAELEALTTGLLALLRVARAGQGTTST